MLIHEGSLNRGIRFMCARHLNTSLGAGEKTTGELRGKLFGSLEPSLQRFVTGISFFFIFLISRDGHELALDEVSTTQLVWDYYDVT